MNHLANNLALLGLVGSPSIAEVKTAYRKKALVVHPDRNKSPGAGEEFIALQKAYTYILEEYYKNGSISLSEAAESVTIDFRGLAELIVLITDQKRITPAAIYKSSLVKGFPCLSDVVSDLSSSYNFEVLLTAENSRIVGLYEGRVLQTLRDLKSDDYNETFRFLVENVSYTLMYRLRSGSSRNTNARRERSAEPRRGKDSQSFQFVRESLDESEFLDATTSDRGKGKILEAIRLKFKPGSAPDWVEADSFSSCWKIADLENAFEFYTILASCEDSASTRSANELIQLISRLVKDGCEIYISPQTYVGSEPCGAYFSDSGDGRYCIMASAASASTIDSACEMFAHEAVHFLQKKYCNRLPIGSICFDSTLKEILACQLYTDNSDLEIQMEMEAYTLQRVPNAVSELLELYRDGLKINSSQFAATPNRLKTIRWICTQKALPLYPISQDTTRQRRVHVRDHSKQTERSSDGSQYCEPPRSKEGHDQIIRLIGFLILVLTIVLLFMDKPLLLFAYGLFYGVSYLMSDKRMK